MTHLRSHNEDLLATIASGLLFIYIWLGLFVLLYFMYQAGFFGNSLGGLLLTGGLCLFFVTPIVPGLISRFVIKPIFINLLGREVITSGGCISGIVLMLLSGIVMLFFVSRNLNIAWIIFLSAPVAGGILSGIISLLSRSGNAASFFSKIFNAKRRGGYRSKRFR